MFDTESVQESYKFAPSLDSPSFAGIALDYSICKRLVKILRNYVVAAKPDSMPNNSKYGGIEETKSVRVLGSLGLSYWIHEGNCCLLLLGLVALIIKSYALENAENKISRGGVMNVCNIGQQSKMQSCIFLNQYVTGLQIMQILWQNIPIVS